MKKKIFLGLLIVVSIGIIIKEIVPVLLLWYVATRYWLGL